MTRLILLTALMFSLMFPSTCFADWTKMSENEVGDTFYVDFERIRKNGGYVYYWTMGDFLKPNHSGYLSDKVYVQADCELFRFKYLSGSFHREPMGRGSPLIIDRPAKGLPPWSYPPPNSAREDLLKTVCKFANRP
jgi:hypothetical protein